MVDDLPRPLREPLRQALAQTEPSRRFRGLIRAFNASIRFLTCVLACDYLARVRLTLAEPPKRLGSRVFERMSLGHWYETSRWILKCGGADAWFVTGLHGALTRKAAKKAAAKLIGLRNDYVHPDIDPPAKHLEFLVTETRSALDTWFEAMAPLAGHAVEGDGPAYTLRSPDGRTLPLFRMLWHGPTAHEPEREELMVFESASRRDVKYLVANDLAYVPQLTEFRDEAGLKDLGASLEQDAQRAIDDFRERSERRADLADLCAHAERQSERVLEVHYANRKYQDDCYVPRVEPEREIANWLHGDARALLLLGDSGYGKTNLMCRLTLEWAEMGHPVLHFSGRAWSGRSWRRELANALVLTGARLDGYLGELDDQIGDRRVVLLVDAINEHDHPVRLLKALNELLAQIENRWPWLRLLITCRLDRWHGIELGEGLGPSFQRFSGADGERPYLLLGAFDDDELAAAYANWMAVLQPSVSKDERIPIGTLRALTGDLLRVPMFLRFYILGGQLADDERAAPPRDAGALLRRYELPEKHRRMLDAVVNAMWRLRTDALHEAHVRQDESVRKYVEEDPVVGESTIWFCAKHPPPEVSLKGLDQVDDPERWEWLKDPDHRCQTCRGPCPESRSFDVFSPYEYLRERGVLTPYEDKSGGVVLRFTYDRFYEAELAARIEAWIGEGHTAIEATAEAHRHPVLWPSAATAILRTAPPDARPERLRTLASCSEWGPDMAASVLHEWSQSAPQAATDCLVGIHRECMKQSDSALEKVVSQAVSAGLGAGFALDWAVEAARAGAQRYSKDLFALLARRLCGAIRDGDMLRTTALTEQLATPFRGVVRLLRNRRALMGAFEIWVKGMLAAGDRPAAIEILGRMATTILGGVPLLNTRGSAWRRGLRRWLLHVAGGALAGRIAEKYTHWRRHTFAHYADKPAWQAGFFAHISLTEPEAAGLGEFRRIVERFDDPPTLDEVTELIMPVLVDDWAERPLTIPRAWTGGLVSLLAAVRPADAAEWLLAKAAGFERWSFGLDHTKYVAALGTAPASFVETIELLVRRLWENHRPLFLRPHPAGVVSARIPAFVMAEHGLTGRTERLEGLLRDIWRAGDHAALHVSLDALLMAASMQPRETCRLMERLVDLRSGRFEDLDLLAVDLETARHVLRQATEAPWTLSELDLDGDRGPALVAATLFQTLGTMTKIAPKATAALYERTSAPPGLLHRVRSFTSPERVQDSTEAVAMMAFMIQMLLTSSSSRALLSSIIDAFLDQRRTAHFATLDARTGRRLFGVLLDVLLTEVEPLLFPRNDA